MVNRTDLRASGNRVAEGVFDLAVAERLVVELEGQPVWVLPFDSDGSWYVVVDSGAAVIVGPDGSTRSVEASSERVPPEIPTGASAAQLGLFDNPLPDTRVVRDGSIVAALVSPTDRYDHGVLGDDLEAAGVQLNDLCTGERVLIEVSSPDVIEGLSPLLADIDGDGETDVLVTVSNDDTGARLVAYRLDGSLLAQSEPIGRGNRWRNQLGVAPVGPGGELEVVDVRIPHIGGVVEYFRVEGDELVLVASASEFTTHVIGSRNLDMGIVADGTGDGDLDVVVLTQDRTKLVVLERSVDGVDLAVEVDLGSPASTNVAVQSPVENTALAIGNQDSQLLIWTSASQ